MSRRCLARVVAGAVLTTATGCAYTWGIEHAPFISGPGPGSRWIRVGSPTAAYDVDLHVPRVGGAAALPLVIVLHGYNGTGPGMERRTGFSELADSVGVAVAYPTARENPQGKRSWSGFDATSPDVAMLGALIDSVATRTALDRGRVYLAGFSNGGGMTYRAGLTLRDRFAAIAVVAGSLPISPERANDVDAPKLPLIAIHGMRDETVRFDGAGRGSSAPGSVRAWAARQGCIAPPVVDTLVSGEAIRTIHGGCRDGSAAILYAMVNGGHGWPTPGAREAPLNSTAIIWDFFSRYSRR